MSLDLTIINRSGWPDWFINPLCRWLAERAGIAWAYTFTLKGVSDLNRDRWRGRGGRQRGNISMHRRCRSAWQKDRRFKWSDDKRLKPGIETLVALIAHEMHHANGGHPRHFMSGGRCNRDLMEFQCNRFGVEAVQAFWQEWPGMRRRAMAGLRRQMERDAARTATAAARRARESSTDFKIQEAEAALQRWLDKAAHAERFAAKYRRKLRALRAANTRRMAAKN